MSNATDAFIQGLPKCELHLHLEGSLRAPTIQTLAERHGIEVGTREYLERQYRFDGFDEFMRLFWLGLDVMRTGEDIADVTDALARELAEQQVRYAEVTTTAYSHQQRGIPVDDYVAGLNDGRRRAQRDHGVEIQWVVDLPREFEPPDAHFTAELITGPRAPEAVVAIGLGGPELGSDPRKYAASFDIARAAGLKSVPHAGEMDGPDSMWGALEALHADRIGHGVRAIEDDRLVRHLAETRIQLEVSLTSNVLLGACASLADHAVGALIERGVVVTFNTDDPAYFSTTLNDELTLARDLLALDEDGLRKTQRTAIECSFASPDTKRAISDEIARYSG